VRACVFEMRDRTEYFRSITKDEASSKNEEEREEKKSSGSRCTETEVDRHFAAKAEMLVETIFQLRRGIYRKESIDMDETSDLMIRANRISGLVGRLEKVVAVNVENPDEIAHRKGAILVLYSFLRSVTHIIEDIQRDQYRIAKIIAQSKRTTLTSSLLLSLPEELLEHANEAYREKTAPRSEVGKRESRPEENGAASKSYDAAVSQLTDMYTDSDEDDIAPAEKQELQQENRNLERELTTQLDDVLQMHAKMAEIAKVCSFLNSKIQDQHWQVERLNESAMRSTELVKKSQNELESAIRHKGSSRKLILWFFLIMGFSLLFLDWYQD